MNDPKLLELIILCLCCIWVGWALHIEYLDSKQHYKLPEKYYKSKVGGANLLLNQNKIQIMDNEYILCAAIWYKKFPSTVYGPCNVAKGVVLCGHRHADIIHQHVSLMQKRQSDMGSHVQGFLTSHNRFLNREEALQVALAANQVKDLNAVRGESLYSEDLY